MKTTKGSQVHGKQKLDKQKQVTKPYDIVMCPLNKFNYIIKYTIMYKEL